MTTTDFRLDGSIRNCVDHATLPVSDRNGATYCFNCIIVGHQAQAYNLACRMLDDRHLAEDAVQEALTSAFRSFNQFRGDNLKAWLMRIVANTCRDMLRSRRSRPSIPLDTVGPDSESEESALTAENLATDVESPEEAALRGELRRSIEAGLESLAEERRLALVLVDVQGFSYEETATILNCSLGTVKSRISRGRRELRDYLQSAGELLPSRFRQEQ